MEGVGSEVSHKIRAAIKAKLIELGAYVDDELPDYIMVMVANKRSRPQMEDDLTLFLNKNTKVFTSWLHTVLQKLQEVTVAANEKKEVEVKKPTKSKRSRSKESAVKAIHPINEKVKSKKKHAKKHKEKKLKKSKHKSKETRPVKHQETREETSDWEAEEPVPKKKVKNEDLLDVTEDVGRTITGSLKERHKSDEKVSEAPIIPSEQISSTLPVDEPTPVGTANITDFGPTVGTSKIPEAQKESEKEDSDGFSVIEVKLNNTITQPEPTIMAPTMELLKEHDKMTSEASHAVASGGKCPNSQSSSEASVSPEELRRQLLLSRAKRKLEERNLDRRMRSNSPEVVILGEKAAANDQSKVAELASVEAPPVANAEKKRSSTPSDRLSLSPSSLGSSPDNSHRSFTSGRRKDKKNKVIVLSRIVAPAETEETGLSSVVHVKPREFAPKEKQANKNLILKAVAAAERSVAHAPSRKPKETSPQAGQRPKALFTRDLRGKRYENFAVILPNLPEKDDSKWKRTKKGTQLKEFDRESEGRRSAPKTGEEDNFISSKTTGKDKSESFIQCWLEEVEEAGKHDALIKPDEIDDVVASGEDGGDGDSTPMIGSNGAEGRIEALKDGPQIIVTVDGLQSNRPASERPVRGRKIKSLVDVNRISNRFARISHPAEDHEFKEKYKEFERVRTEKKISREGESKNKRLIAELSMKFGQVNRVFDDEGAPVRIKRIGEERRSEDRKREAGRSSNNESVSKEKRERKSIRISADYDDLRMNSKERCRYWPDCARGSSCDFHHPSSICMLLPKCKFKDKCLYIHPLCRNDRDCVSKDCAYEHSPSRRRKSDPPRDSVRSLCKYDSYCKNVDCPYQHSKRSCRYGSRCRSRDCPFLHGHKSPI